MGKTNRYDADSLEVLTGLEPVRKRPGMYTDTECPNHLAQEVVDNAVDEAIAGHADRICVELLKDGSLSVRDNGRGMPVDIHPEHGISGVELILTRLHAGAKFSDKHYTFSGGLHGVGVSVVNALAEWLEVEIMREGARWKMRFENGEPVSPLEKIGRAKKSETGTLLHFSPQPSYFDRTEFDVESLKYLLRAKAVLCANLRVEFTGPDGDQEVWQYGSGLAEYLTQACDTRQNLLAEPFMGEAENGRQAVRWAMQWHDEAPGTICESYVNLIPTAQGGSHVAGLRGGVLDAVREFCTLRDLLPKGLTLNADDVMASAAWVLSLQMNEPQFSGQTKQKLSSRECTPFIAQNVRDRLSLWLNQHHEEAGSIVERAIENAQLRRRSAQKVERKRAAHSGPMLPGKLADCTSPDRRDTELFLVEGDSAGGSARQARDRTMQAVMPLRGKIRNTWEVGEADLFSSEEVRNISIALGVEPGAGSDLGGLRYGKVCVLADADSDGLHIATLLIALFRRHFPRLVEAGHLYMAMPPLYRVDVGDEVHYPLDDAECEQLLKSLGQKRSVSVQRFKGLGEMNPEQLKQTTMALATRRLVQMQMQDDEADNLVLNRLLARDAAEERRHWLEREGNAAALDSA
ncbi:MAG: DNA topoisomerase IV subunit B [Gammaproteobacteria bacterium AqS3]|nr:DNA topoisomerase IV subunit B [Gammaproteobacteria bacterium AqS3]